MPNWIEGTLKVRGKAENLIRFMETAIDAGVTPIEYGDFDLEFPFPNMAYIKDSRRAFTRESRFCVVDKSVEKNQIITIPIKQAWSFTPAEGEELRWVRLAKEYGVDIRLQGFECGMQFYQDLAIENGEITVDEVTEYDDWDWDCPMPDLGG